MAQNQNYSEEDIQEILKLASNRQDSQSMSSDVLRRSAAELGISEEHLAAAEAEHAANIERAQARRKFAAKRREAFYAALVPYVLVNSFLIYLSLNEREFWFLYIIGFWSISIAKQAWAAFGPNQDAAFEQWQKKQERPALVDVSAALEDYRKSTGDYAIEEKLMAIKHVREQTGMGLKESKEAVDQFTG